MDFTDEFKAHELKTRPGRGGQTFTYVDARTVAQRLDDVVGPFGWQSTYEFFGDTIVCTISIWSGDLNLWVSKSDGGTETDIEGEKGGLSDAFKRAAVKWGVGRYLYSLDSSGKAPQPKPEPDKPGILNEMGAALSERLKYLGLEMERGAKVALLKKLVALEGAAWTAEEMEARGTEILASILDWEPEPSGGNLLGFMHGRVSDEHPELDKEAIHEILHECLPAGVSSLADIATEGQAILVVARAKRLIEGA